MSLEYVRVVLRAADATGMTVFAQLPSITALVPRAIRIARNIGERDKITHFAALGLRNALIEGGDVLGFGVPGSRWVDVTVATCSRRPPAAAE